MAAAAAATSAEDATLAALNALWAGSNASRVVNSRAIAAQLGTAHEEFDGTLKTLESADYIACVAGPETLRWTLTAKGEEVLAQGSPEFAVFSAVPQEGSISMKALNAKVGKDLSKIGLGKARVLGWIAMEKGNVLRKVATISDETRASVEVVARTGQLPDALAKDFHKRKIIQKQTLKSWDITKGEKFQLTFYRTPVNLSLDDRNSGAWKQKEYKPYNFNSLGVAPQHGALHPLMKVRTELRNILLEMNFAEMPTQRYVESSFWNFDSLFQPQQHAARDAHDTFFLDRPQTSDLSEERASGYLDRVKEMHEVGSRKHGSIGWRYEWSEAEAAKNILRTHTTAVSSRMLYKLAQDTLAAGEFTPRRYFSIDRVFRNETIDRTHLAEFHQVEGLVADKGLTLGDLMGTIKAFFERIGISRVEFKPAYNPYTEPSMEIFGFHPGLGKLIEIGNSGIFRPEMLLPMGLPPDVRVIAWGLGLERPTMIKYGIDNIRDLFGVKVDVEAVRDAPLARY